MTTETVEETSLPATIQQDEADHAESIGAELYNPYSDFQTPFKIRGSGKIMAINPIFDQESSSEQNMTKIGQLSAYERTFSIYEVGSLHNFELVDISSTHVIFRREGDTANNFVMHLHKKEDNAGFKVLSSLLGIPYSFAKKNPGYLNKVTFDHYLHQTRSTNKKVPGLRVLYVNTPQEVQIEGKTSDQPVVTMNAFPVLSVFKMAGNTEDLGVKEAKEHVALPAQFIERIVKDPEVSILQPSLKTVATSFTVENRGSHFYRMLFDSPDAEFEAGGEKYKIGMTLKSSLLGIDRDHDYVDVSVSLMRLVCANGMTVPLKDSQFIDLIGTLSEEERAAVGDYALNSEGIRLPVKLFNTSAGSKLVANFIKALASLKVAFKEQLERAYEVQLLIDNPDQFIDTARDLAKKFEISPEITKYFLMEYCAGEITGEQIFKRPIDVLNFLTFTSRAYNTAITHKVEQVGYSYVMALYQQLVEKQAQVSSFSAIRNSMSREYREEQPAS